MDTVILFRFVFREACYLVYIYIYVLVELCHLQNSAIYTCSFNKGDDT